MLICHCNLALKYHAHNSSNDKSLWNHTILLEYIELCCLQYLYQNAYSVKVVIMKGISYLLAKLLPVF